MGEVWLARHLDGDGEVALKQIHPHLAIDPRFRGRFLREIRVMTDLLAGCPNIVVTLDSGLDHNGHPYFVMEYIRGRSLDLVLSRGKPMAIGWTAQILIPVCESIQYAHDKGVLHRDIKPSNILLPDRLGGPLTPKVSDFGLCKILEIPGMIPPECITAPGEFLGTPPYASPEQSRGMSDTRSDIYSIGVLLFRLLTGHLPFTGPALGMAVHTLISSPPAFAEVNPSICLPKGVEEMVLGCLSKDPADRPETAREIARGFLPFVDC